MRDQVRFREGSSNSGYYELLIYNFPGNYCTLLMMRVS
jgi:hypothetical protein